MSKGKDKTGRDVLERLTRHVFARVVAGVARTTNELDLSIAQVAALYVIDDREGVRASALAEELGRSPAAMSRLLSGLEAKKLIARTPHPTDRRALVLTLTKRGHAFIDTTSKARVRAISSVGQLFPEGAFERMIAMAAGALDKTSS